MTPTNEQKTQEIKVYRNVFDLDSKDDVSVVKVGTFTPVASMQEFVSHLKNDAGLILRLCNRALAAYAEEQLAADPNVPYMQEQVDETTGVVAYEPFSGTLLSEEKSKQLNANVVTMAKLLFGYDKTMDADKTKNRDLKKEAKGKALDMILSNPAVIEVLKKS